MHVALYSVVKVGFQLDYDICHQQVPDDLMRSFERVGIHNWSIWRTGIHLFHLVECDDFTQAMNALEKDPANIRWQAEIGPFVDHFVTTGEGPAGMMLSTVWTLEAQRHTHPEVRIIFDQKAAGE
jgi:L-rhamnose mutarotase